MYDIRFYKNTHLLVQKLIDGKATYSSDALFEMFEKERFTNPVVYNIETTNACNMKCQMCPRTRLMTRKVETLNEDTFRSVVNQLRPWTEAEWQEWTDFVGNAYGVMPDQMSENHFFLYIIPRVIQLHGYGDPLLDKHMPEYVGMLTSKNMNSYFSCNPANIDVKKIEQMFENGLDYIKFSVESVDDKTHQEIRGSASNFTESYQNLLELLALKKKQGYETTIVITMLDLNQVGQKEEYAKLRRAFQNKDVYIYLKSEDQQWYRQNYHGTGSIHWSEICRHPWTSMSVKSNGEVAMCMEDFNNDIILGDARVDALASIWNSKAYEQFRMAHARGAAGLKCQGECDMAILGNFYK